MTTLLVTARHEVRTPLDLLRAPLPGATTNPLIRAVDWLLRGVSQVVFQSNWLTGLVILGGIFYNSRVYGVACVVGVVASTGTALLLGVDRGLIDAGLMGFNGALLGIGLNAYMSDNFTKGAWPDWRLYAYIVIGAAFTTVIMAALGTLLGPFRVPALTAPFVFTAWLFIFAVLKFQHLHPGPLLSAALPKATTEASHYTWQTWYQGTFKGVAEIFFQDNWITGVIFVVALALNSRVGAIVATLGSLIGLAGAIVLGAPEATVHLGLFGFNAALTALAIGGFFFVLDWRGFVYMLFGVVVTTFVWASVADFLSPIGMPTFTSAFVIVAWFLLIAKDGFKSVVAVAPADATFPEDHIVRWRQQLRSPGSGDAARR